MHEAACVLAVHVIKKIIHIFDNMHGHEASSLITGLKINALNETLIIVTWTGLGWDYV